MVTVTLSFWSEILRLRQNKKNVKLLSFSSASIFLSTNNKDSLICKRNSVVDHAILETNSAFWVLRSGRKCISTKPISNKLLKNGTVWKDCPLRLRVSRQSPHQSLNPRFLRLRLRDRVATKILRRFWKGSVMDLL